MNEERTLGKRSRKSCSVNFNYEIVNTFVAKFPSIFFFQRSTAVLLINIKGESSFFFVASRHSDTPNFYSRGTHRKRS